MEFGGKYLKCLIIFTVAYEIQSWRSYVMDFTTLEVEINEDLTEFHDLKLIKIQGHHTVNGTVLFRRELTNVTLNFEINIPRAQSQDWTLINVTVDACKFLEDSSDEAVNLSYILLKQLQESENFFPRKCPIEKGKLIFVENMYLDVERFPPYVPDAKFKSTVQFSESGVLILKISIDGYAQSKSAIRKTKKKIFG